VFGRGEAIFSGKTHGGRPSGRGLCVVIYYASAPIPKCSPGENLAMLCKKIRIRSNRSGMDDTLTFVFLRAPGSPTLPAVRSQLDDIRAPTRNAFCLVLLSSTISLHFSKKKIQIVWYFFNKNEMSFNTLRSH